MSPDEYVRLGSSEGLSLEFKNSEILKRRDLKTFSKSITALANADGGRLVIGVEENDGVAYKLDEGLEGNDLSEWISRIASLHCKPAINGVQVERHGDELISYYIANVPKSSEAPHQAHDNKYYRRTGSNSVPMEHYEIEDIRYRSLLLSEPVSVRIEIEQGSLIVLSIENVSKTILRDVNVSFDVDFGDSVIPKDLTRLTDRTYVSLHPKTSHRYWVGHTFELLGKKGSHRQITCNLVYDDSVRIRTSSFKFDLNDYHDGLLPRVEIEEQFKRLNKSIEKFVSIQGNFAKSIAVIAQAYEPTGLRLANSTLRYMAEEGPEIPTVNPTHLEFKSVIELLNISSEETSQLHKLLRAIQFRTDNVAEEFERLSESSQSKYLHIFDDPRTN